MATGVLPGIMVAVFLQTGAFTCSTLRCGLLTARCQRPYYLLAGIYAYKDNAIETADTQTVIYEYPDLLIEWEHVGGLNKGFYGRHYGVAFIGNNGTLVINREGWEVIPEEEGGIPKIEAVPFRSADKKDHEKHVNNFISSIKSREMPICDVEIGKNSATLAHMGNVAYRTGNKLYWDKPKENFTNDAKANALYQPVYRAAWKFPKIYVIFVHNLKAQR